jgi:type VI secretion system secreted protein Hcp
MFSRLSTLALVSSLLATAVVLTPQQADAALNTYISKAKGEKQGAIKGGVVKKGLEGSIRVVELHHEIVSPRDAASGLPTGKRTHKPLQLVLEVDAATPQLLQAMLSGERLTEVVLPAFGKNKLKGSGEVKYYEIKLTDAMITSYRLADSDAGDAPATVTIELVYRKIEWTWIATGVTATDDWEGASSAKKPKAASPQPPKAK